MTIVPYASFGWRERSQRCGVEEGLDDGVLAEMQRDDGLDVCRGEVAIAERPGPDGEIGAIVATTLATTRAEFDGVGERVAAQGGFEGGAERFAVAEWAVAEVDAVGRCCHVTSIAGVK